MLLKNKLVSLHVTFPLYSYYFKRT